MIQSLAVGVAAGCFAAAMVSFARIRGNAHLEAKLRVLRRLLLVVALALSVLLGLFVAHGSQMPRIPIGGDVDVETLRGHLEALRDHERSGVMLVPIFVFVLVMALPVVFHVLGELASFVLRHRSDLAARDLVASYEGH
jgi:hypothetical protein